jgi:hypothetical protein
MEDQTFDSGFPIPAGVPVTAVKRDVWQPYSVAGLHVAEDHSVKNSSSGSVTDRERSKTRF